MSRAPTCGVRIASQQRVAHVISLDTSSYRFQQSAALLRYLGFAVRHFLPIPKDDPQVVAWEKRFQRDSDTEHSPRGSISLSLSHLTLWRTFPTDGEWLCELLLPGIALTARSVPPTAPLHARRRLRGRPNARAKRREPAATTIWQRDAARQAHVAVAGRRSEHSRHGAVFALRG